MGRTIWSRYGFVWVTGGFFLISLVGHWIFGWFAYAQEQGLLAKTPSSTAILSR